jgi:hypothetical protein
MKLEGESISPASFSRVEMGSRPGYQAPRALVYCECHGEVNTDTLVLLKDWKLNPFSVADVTVTVTTKLYQPEPAYISA